MRESVDAFVRGAEQFDDLTMLCMEFRRDGMSSRDTAGAPETRARLSGLCLEEMAGNVVTHGFSADRKRHSVDIRVVCKGDELILRIKDDCVQFDPVERNKIMDPGDKASNIGIRLVYDIASEINYQHILGLNVLTVRI